jgi:hypothetical protein
VADEKDISTLFASGKHGNVRGIYPVGSRVTCNPPPSDTDEDWLVHVLHVDTEALVAAGFKQDGSPQFYAGNDNGGFRSWRRDELNVITTQSAEFFWRFVTATDLAKRFNLLAKADRIALFQAVLYGVRSENLEQARVALPALELASQQGDG